MVLFFFFSSRRRHTRWTGDWSSDVCSSDLRLGRIVTVRNENRRGLARIPGCVPQEAHPKVNRQTPGRLPRVLRVELVDETFADHFRERIDLGVIAERSEQRIRVAVVRVERIIDVRAEVELPG